MILIEDVIPLPMIIDRRAICAPVLSKPLLLRDPSKSLEFANRPGNIAIPPMHRRELVHFREFRTARTRTGPIQKSRLMSLKNHLVSLACWILLAGPAAGATPEEIESLLDAAEAAERVDHLIYPASGSAMSLYQEILFHEPDNAHAQEGLVRLAEHFLEQAQNALSKDQLLKADSLVSRARMIYPDYPGVAAMQHQIELLDTAERTRETLDWRLVSARSSELAGQLARLGSTAKSGDCRATINVSNDSEGRWIYRQMNDAPGPGRLKAEVKIASPAAIEIVCFKSPEQGDHEA